MSNPFNCNCHLGWFADWLRARQLSGGSPRCGAPARLRDASLAELASSEFRCQDGDQGCLGADYCPPKCTCTGTVVRCSHAKLSDIPRGIPPETSELYLDVNEIESVSVARISHLKSLTRL